MKRLILCVSCCMLVLAGCDSAKNETIINHLEQQLALSSNKIQETQERLDKAQNEYAAVTKQLADANAKLAVSDQILMYARMNSIIEGATYYCYLNRSNNEIILMGKLQGKGEDIEYPGDGRVITHRKRGSIIQTWFHDQTYKLNAEHLLVEVPQDLYSMNAKVKMTKALQLYKSRNSKEKAFIIQPGTDAEIVSSDDKRWSMILASNGQKGWFEVEPYNKLVGSAGTTDDYMSGLIQAD